MARRDQSDTVAGELRQSSETAADLANAMQDSIAATGAGSETASARDDVSPAHHKDAVPEGLRHTSEVAAELANRVFSAIRERLHFNHPDKSAPGHGSGSGSGSERQ
ncbi:hypothetical protein VOLCADRAFT_94828 [Volvox carteri f. nagariensis]|uniref:Uncharacterized protein n=1 Tax=Volvox carteri f. nagariensis TaxID=3068 RepID=D8U5V7_VOLCA|nr:uncharacterized protein VOLCADRAFT_94828 [Volvox carteri f. nagariensis]EFJ44824.1 hypothetical protein VOLCADRAFT_94828 [Volvox carteri f. nagariensis]|eukprot:XP_002954107.1 hypothetical protein VOLCADRAFT_94828 [Volvox carteri f. nagariensis]